jgi:hypothetical protein
MSDEHGCRETCDAWTETNGCICPRPPGFRQRSLNGQPANDSRFLRGCKACKASFLWSPRDQMGIWRDWNWYCSVECAQRARPDYQDHNAWLSVVNKE